MGPKEAVTYVDGRALCIDCAAHARELVAPQPDGDIEAAPTASPARLVDRLAG